MPLQRRVPKLKGFKPRNKKEYQLINVEKLNIFSDGDEVTPETLMEHGLIRKADGMVKILGNGDLHRRVRVKAHAFTRTAVAKIQASGGSVEEV